MVLYASKELISISTGGKSNIYLYAIDSEFAADHKFDLDKVTSHASESVKIANFQVAFGLTNYDSNYESIEDSNYATLKARAVGWGADAD